MTSVTQFEAMLMGGDSGQMNLKSVRTRADDLRTSIDRLLQTLQFNPASLAWSDILDKFALFNVQLQNLADQLRPLLQHYIVHPRSVNQTNAPILPIMLATRLLPEQEAERQQITMMQTNNNNGATATASTTTTSDDIADYNSFIDTLANTLVASQDSTRGGRRSRLPGAASTVELGPRAPAATSTSAAAVGSGSSDRVEKEAKEKLLKAIALGQGLL